MAEEYISLDVTVEESTLGDDAISRLQDRWPTWEPNDGDMEVVQIEAIASMAASVADTAASVPATILEALGQELFGVEPNLGSPAVGSLAITFINAAGNYLVPAGSEFDIDGFAFAVDSDVRPAVGQATVTGVPITATEIGTAFNDLPGSYITPISAIASVLSADLEGTTFGGEEEDTPEDYMGRLLLALRQNSRTLTTLRDYELFALAYSDVGRALALNNGARAVAIWLLTPTGQAVSTTRKNALLVEYDENREVNTNVSIYDPAFGVINVTYTVAAYPNYDPTDLTNRINAKLADQLDPFMWGRPKYIGDISTQLWVNDITVRHNKLIDAIGDVEGVNYVYSLVISGTVEGTGAALTVSGRSQIDTLSKSGSISSGTYKLTLDGQETAALNPTATGSQVLAALEALSNVEPGDLAISGDAFPLTLEHTGNYYGRTRSLTVTSSTLVGGSMAVATTRSAQAGTGDVTLPTNSGVGLPRPGVFTGKVIK